MDKNDGIKTKKIERTRLSWKKRILFFSIILITVLIFAECGMRLIKSAISVKAKDVKAGQKVGDCKSIGIITIGDSMTFGLGAEKHQSYPNQLESFWKLQYPSAKLKVYNLGVAGSNTSEQFTFLKNFIRSSRRAKPDFALILLGVNNRWNLHNASFWESQDEARKGNYLKYLTSKLQLTKFFNVALQNRVDSVKLARETNAIKYRKMLSDHGWDMFFTSFEDELLSNWIEKDLLDIAEYCRRYGIEPIFLTYHYKKFDHLNDLIRKTANKAGAPLIELEKPVFYYAKQKMLSQDKFHPNAKGYKALANRIVSEFGNLYENEKILSILKEKSRISRCNKLMLLTPVPEKTPASW